MDEIVITDSGYSEVLATTPDVELISLDSPDQDVVFTGDIGLQGPKGDPGEQGPKGDPGPAGSGGGDAHYRQDFMPATTVTVTHNLGKYPAVTVFTSAGDEVECAVDHLSTNQLLVTFDAPNSGTVVCN